MVAPLEMSVHQNISFKLLRGEHQKNNHCYSLGLEFPKGSCAESFFPSWGHRRRPQNLEDTGPSWKRRVMGFAYMISSLLLSLHSSLSFSYQLSNKKSVFRCPAQYCHSRLLHSTASQHKFCLFRALSGSCF